MPAPASSRPPHARLLGGVVVVFALLLALAAGTGAVWGAFKATTQNTGNELRAVPDFIAPEASASVVQKAEGGTPGFIRPGGSFRALAAVTDEGRPSSGITSVGATADGLGTFATLAPGTSTVAGRAYNRVSPVTTIAGLTAGSYTYGLDLRDGAGNTRTQPGFPVVVDGTAPAAADVRAANTTGVAGRPDTGDQVVFGYTEPLDPESILAGWGGEGRNVQVRIANSSPRDLLTIRNAAGTVTLPLGTVDLGSSGYVVADRAFGASGSPSTMVHSNGVLTVTLGSASGSTNTVSSGSLSWTPAAGATDRAGNPSSTTTRAGSNGTGRDF